MSLDLILIRNKKIQKELSITYKEFELLRKYSRDYKYKIVNENQDYFKDRIISLKEIPLLLVTLGIMAKDVRLHPILNKIEEIKNTFQNIEDIEEIKFVAD